VAGNLADFPLPNGQTLTASVLAVDSQKVKLDFNHPLAGLPLTFQVHVLAVEPA
jgi:FKBP-type peptidyl-prolyl cis-trans isomerase SlpA